MSPKASGPENWSGGEAEPSQLFCGRLPQAGGHKKPSRIGEPGNATWKVDGRGEKKSPDCNVSPGPYNKKINLKEYAS